MLSRLAGAFLILCILAGEARACTLAPHVDAEAFFRDVALKGWVLSGMSFAAAFGWIVVARRLNSVPAVVLLLLAVLNPGWWGPGIGDCGSFALEVGAIMASLSTIVFAVSLWWRRKARGQSSALSGV